MLTGAACIDPPEIAPRLWEGFSGETGWDVGANCGQSVGWMFATTREVFAFEPESEAFAVLSRAYGGRDGLHLLQLAVSGTDGTVSLCAIPERLAKGELVTPGPYLAAMGYPASGEGVPFREVPARTADSLAAELGLPDFIKVDTEGHEAMVLRGAAGILAAGKTGWLIEFHAPDLHAECCELLTGAGYRAETVRHPHYAPGSRAWEEHGWIRALAPISRA